MICWNKLGYKSSNLYNSIRKNTGMEQSGSNTDHGVVPSKNQGPTEKDEEPAENRSHTENNDSLPSGASTYIPPGDTTYESYRLGTFAKYPKFAEMSSPIKGLAASGFFFTGFQERIQCFSCGGVAENLPHCTNGAVKCHKKDCRMMTGNDSTNITRRSSYIPSNNVSQSDRNVLKRRQGQDSVPLLSRHCQNLSLEPNNVNMTASCDEKEQKKLDLRSECTRRITFNNCCNQASAILKNDLAINGFFISGENGETKCFSCARVVRNWAEDDDVHNKHRSISPDCRVVIGIESGNIPMTDAQRKNVDNEGPSQFLSNRNESYTEEDIPSNPSMDLIEARKTSFSSGWPENAGISSNDLAEAGFYHLGEGDRVKCFYCNGGLENWKQGYEPWLEHAKWFPSCAYLVLKKGAAFVQTIFGPHCPEKITAPRAPDSPPTKSAKLMRKSEKPDQPNTEGKCIAESQDQEKQQLCKMCKRSEIDIICMPCGHKSCCGDCASREYPCPSCWKKIENTRKVYRE